MGNTILHKADHGWLNSKHTFSFYEFLQSGENAFWRSLRA
jgi:hypothetical protein